MQFFQQASTLMGALSRAADEHGPEKIAQAAQDHVAEQDDDALATHLSQSVDTLGDSSLASLGGNLLRSFGAQGHDADGAAAAAGTSVADVQGGDPGAVRALIDYARANPGVLQGAAGAFMQHDPSAIGRLAPGFLQGILGRLG